MTSQQVNYNLFDTRYQELLTEVVHDILFFDYYDKSVALLHKVEEVINNNNTELDANKDVANFYNKIILSLKFVALPALDDAEIISLFKHNFSFKFNLPEVDLKRKLNLKFLSIAVVDDRNKLKDSLVAALHQNQEKISNAQELNNISDCLRNYLSHIGEENKKLAHAQYIVDINNRRDLSTSEKENIKYLCDIFDFLNIKSDQPDGLEEEPVVVDNGQLAIFKKGILEPIAVNKQVQAMFDKDKDEVAAFDNESFESLDTKNRVTMTENTDKIKTLSEALSNYSPTSLEYKAIKEEINRLRKQSS